MAMRPCKIGVYFVKFNGADKPCGQVCTRHHQRLPATQAAPGINQHHVRFVLNSRFTACGTKLNDFFDVGYEFS
jgi:hypothetical protein